MDNLHEDVLNYLFKNMVTVEPREHLPFKRGKGLLKGCLERYIQMEMKRFGKKEGTLTASCSYVRLEEEKLFNDVLFKLFFDSEYIYGSELYIILEEFSKLVGMTNKEICNILNGLSMIQVKIRDEEESGFFSISSLFLGSETGNCFNTETGENDSEDHYYALQINPEFLKACMEIKAISTLAGNITDTERKESKWSR
ncbi:hypothetical protein [Heyndrickxia ginsengihumi]|uniref:hypothetical protein n=1 Tax=Heyndrickxia ginsengihumi TaxID=363870 RepID=UPI003D1D81DD